VVYIYVYICIYIMYIYICYIYSGIYQCFGVIDISQITKVILVNIVSPITNKCRCVIFFTLKPVNYILTWSATVSVKAVEGT